MGRLARQGQQVRSGEEVNLPTVAFRQIGNQMEAHRPALATCLLQPVLEELVDCCRRINDEQLHGAHAA